VCVSCASALASVEALGDAALVQFVDLNADVSESRKHFSPELRRLASLQRQLRLFGVAVSKAPFDFRPHPLDVHVRAQTEPLDEIEARCDELERELRAVDGAIAALLRDQNAANEQRHVLLATEGEAMAADARGAADAAVREAGGADADRRPAAPRRRHNDDVELGAMEPHGGAQRAQLAVLVGVLERQRVSQFERQLWRSLHGNLFMRKIDVGELLRSHSAVECFVEKSVVVVFYRGDASRVKVTKLLAAYDSHVYECPSDAAQRERATAATRERLAELGEVLARSSAHRQALLANIYGHAQAWSVRVQREMATCEALNQLRWDHGHRYLVALAWCVESDVERVRGTLDDAAQRFGSATAPVLKTVQLSGIEPPTHFVGGPFMGAVQALVDAYGVPSYLEVNPAVLASVTFPFLFGVMFGDVGHGGMLLLVALALIGVERRYGAAAAVDEISSMLLSARYLILAMALWSIYAGLLYSDAFGVAFSLLPSRWARPVEYHGAPTAYAVQCRRGTIAFGIDPIWKGADNEIEFTNSLKKKMAVVLGVVQMTVGVLLSGSNALFFRRSRDFWGEFVPQLLMFGCSFGYMVFLIVLKWVRPGPAPTLINIMIDMFLAPGKCCTPATELFVGQGALQVLLLAVVVLTLPWMLFYKPCIVGRRRRRQRKGYRLAKKHDADNDADAAGDDNDNDDHDDADALNNNSNNDTDADEAEEAHGYANAQMHQAIHTIEFVLSSVSNTASYLRLWALSLAHVELSIVFWERVVEAALARGSAPLIFVAMSVWLAMTIGVMLSMEALSAFLHSLRLQWVEFQSKFYRGEGKRFAPFSLANS
jgi:V-type H+-transporting ATPase subunit a